jgi:hypothetical protein
MKTSNFAWFQIIFVGPGKSAGKTVVCVMKKKELIKVIKTLDGPSRDDKIAAIKSLNELTGMFVAHAFCKRNNLLGFVLQMGIDGKIVLPLTQIISEKTRS